VDNSHTYWKTAMLDRMTIDQADSLFVKTMAHYLFKEKYESENIPFRVVMKQVDRFSRLISGCFKPLLFQLFCL